MSFSRPVKSFFVFLPIFLVFAANQVTGWWILRAWNVRGVIDFQDLNAVLYNTDCFNEIGWSIYGTQAGDACQNYVYGSTLIQFLDLFSLGSAERVPLGWAALVIISYILSQIGLALINTSKKIFAVFILLAVSPPILLLVERGNFDWLVFACLFLGALGFSKKHNFLGFLILAFSALLKFYTFPVLLLSILLLKNRKQKLLALLLSLVVLLQIIRDLLELRSIYIGAWFAAFGNSIWAKYLAKLDINLDVIASAVLGIVVTIFLVFLIKFVLNTESDALFRIHRASTMDYFAIFSSVTFLACYFAGLNYDYRLIYVLPCMWFFISISNTLFRRIIFLLFMVSFFFSYNVKYFQPIGDLSLNLLVAIILLRLFGGIRDLWQSKLRGKHVQ